MTDRGTPLARRSIWIAQGITIAGLLIYVLIVRLAAPALLSAGRGGSVAFGALLAIIPAALWLLLFYVQDAKEPEPLGFVLQVAIAGGIIAGAVALPIIARIPTRAWLGAGPITGLLVSILVVGSVQEFCKYLAVRFIVYDEDEFDEIPDGVTYGTAAGVGLATVLNLWLVLNSPSIAPMATALRIVVTTLAHGAFGGVLGYFLGRAKILGEQSNVLRGFLAAALLNGVVTFLLREVSRSGLTYRPWNGVILAAVIATAVTLVLFRVERTRVEAAA